jgi:hypothetical protein
MDEDLKHLRWLGNGYYANAALLFLFGLFPFIHLAIGIALVSGSFPDPSGKGPPAAFGWIFVAAAAIIILFMQTAAVCNLLAGRFIKQHKNYTFCFVMGAINCMFAPIGLILGVFTILLLLRDPVKEIFKPQLNNFAYQPAVGELPPDWR